jgi:hypothetical protein
VVELSDGEYPYGLAITENNILWTDWNRFVGGGQLYDGEYPYGLAITENNILWTDWNRFVGGG